MTKHKRKNIAFFKKVLDELFIAYKNTMRLNKSWSINVTIEDKKDTYAEVVYDYKRRDFKVKVSSDLNQSITSLRDSIIHEFWHILLSPMKDRFERTLDKIEKGRKVNIKRLREQIKNEDERMVRKFTRIIRTIENNNKKKK